MRRSAFLLSGFVPFHEWHLHEPLLQNYEGWRILDNPKYESKFHAYTYDLTGSVRHLDPIIDDPRLTHQQRVCRLYKWALKELQMYLVRYNAFKFNLCYKVIRGRFEKYRYVTDPATCDMMVRETQKYLREMACYHYMKRNPTSPNMNLTLVNPMFHPDHCQVYDHWTQPEVFWYDDAKIHRWNFHHPMYSVEYGQERYGRYESSIVYNSFFLTLIIILCMFYVMLHLPMFFIGDEALDTENARWNTDLRSSVYAEERRRRRDGYSSLIDFDWNHILGTTKPFYTYGSDTVMPAK